MIPSKQQYEIICDLYHGSFGNFVKVRKGNEFYPVKVITKLDD